MSTKYCDNSIVFKSRSKSLAFSNQNEISKETMQFGSGVNGLKKRFIERDELKMSHIL
jgi:hypothetical protein